MRRRDLPKEDGYAPSDKEIARFASDFSSSFAEKIRAERKGKRRDPEHKRSDPHLTRRPSIAYLVIAARFKRLRDVGVRPILRRHPLQGPVSVGRRPFSDQQTDAGPKRRWLRIFAIALGGIGFVLGASYVACLVAFPPARAATD